MELLPIPGEWIVQGGAVAVCILFVIAILRGGLVPRKIHEELQHDRDMWRLIALKAMGQTEALIPAAEISTKVAQGLFNATVEQALTGSQNTGDGK